MQLEIWPYTLQTHYPQWFTEFDKEKHISTYSVQKEHLIDLSKNIDILQEKTANCIYERFFRLSTQGKTYI